MRAYLFILLAILALPTLGAAQSAGSDRSGETRGDPLPAAGEVRTYTVNWTDTAPTPDGVVSAGEYDDAEAATGAFRLLRTGPPPTASTESLSWRAVWTDDTFYLVIESDYTAWDPGAVENGDDSIGFQETLEIFIDPNLDNEDNVAGDTNEDSYQMQIAIPPGLATRAAGAPGPPFLVTAARIDALFGDTSDGGWDPTEIAFARNATGSGGVFEFAIPFAELNATFGGGADTSLDVSGGVSNGDTWLFNLARIASSGELPVWNYHEGDGASAFFAEREFGEITFQGQPGPTAAKTGQLFE